MTTYLVNIQHTRGLRLSEWRCQVKMADNMIICTKMCARESFCLLRQHCWSEQSALSWGKYGQTSWTPPPQPPSSSTLQITSVVASGAQIITLCYFSSHTLLLKSWLPGCLAASALIASRHAIDPTPLLRIWMGSGGGWWVVEGAAQESAPSLYRFTKAQVNQFSSMLDHGNSTMRKLL